MTFLGKLLQLSDLGGERGDNHIYLQGLLSVRVIGAHPRSHFPVGNSHS